MRLVLVKALPQESLAKRPANCTQVVAVVAQEHSVTFTLKLERVAKAVAVLAAKMLLELLALKTPEVVAAEVLRAGTTTQFVCPVPVALASCASGCTRRARKRGKDNYAVIQERNED